MSLVQLIEWDGEEYSIKYSFALVQRLKAKGIHVGRIFSQIQSDPNGAGAYLDDYAATVFECLREAGAPVKQDVLWRECLGNPEFAAACAQLFMWLVSQHYAASPNAPASKNA